MKYEDFARLKETHPELFPWLEWHIGPQITNNWPKDKPMAFQVRGFVENMLNGITISESPPEPTWENLVTQPTTESQLCIRNSVRYHFEGESFGLRVIHLEGNGGAQTVQDAVELIKKRHKAHQKFRAHTLYLDIVIQQQTTFFIDHKNSIRRCFEQSITLAYFLPDEVVASYDHSRKNNPSDLLT